MTLEDKANPCILPRGDPEPKVEKPEVKSHICDYRPTGPSYLNGGGIYVETACLICGEAGPIGWGNEAGAM